MSKTYYDPADLRKFGNITEWSEELGAKFLIITTLFFKKVHSQLAKNR